MVQVVCDGPEGEFLSDLMLTESYHVLTLMQEGWFSGHPYEVVAGGLGGVQTALENLKEGKASAVKYVFRIGETEGVGKD